MRWAFVALLVVHGLIHLMGFAKAFRFAELAQLTQPISRPMGVAWLVAAVLFLATAVALFAWPRGWWAVGAAAIVVSQVVIVSSWTDAKFGTIANGIALAGLVIGFFAQGPTSLRARFEAEAAPGMVRTASTGTLTEADRVALPRPVQRYLHGVGVVGHQPAASEPAASDPGNRLHPTQVGGAAATP